MNEKIDEILEIKPEYEKSKESEIVYIEEQPKILSENRDLMKKAREILNGKWGKANGKWGISVGATFVYAIIMFPISIIPIAGQIIAQFFWGVFSVGFALFWLSIIRQKDVKKSLIFSGFKIFWKCFAVYFMKMIFILLWYLLLIFPGIMALCSYAMTSFIIADNPEVRIFDAINQSKKMMYGYRWKLFCLYWRFFGWMLLCGLTCGIGILWLFPYMGTTFACFYEEIKDKN